MEPKGMMDKIEPLYEVHFIGMKCLKFLESRIQIKNTVSIVPIIGGYKRLSGSKEAEFETETGKIFPEIF